MMNKHDEKVCEFSLKKSIFFYFLKMIEKNGQITSLKEKHQ